MSLAQTFREVESVAGASEFTPTTMKLSGTGVSVPAGEILAGVESNRHRHLLIPIEKPESPRVDEESRGIHVTEKFLYQQGGERWYVDFSCQLDDLNDLFVDVAEDVLQAVVLETEKSAFASAVTVLGKWRHLIGRDRSGKISEDKLAGLFAELLLLNRKATADPVAAFIAWAGPESNDHDFCFSTGDLECKATQVKVGWKTKINGIKQLAKRPDRTLHLVVFRLKKAPDGKHVPELIDEAVSLGIERIKLLEKMNGLVGYHPLDEPKYKEVQFVVEETRLYEVTDEFPGLTPAHLVDGKLHFAVQSLSYVVDLGTAGTDFLREEGEDEVLGAIDDL